MESMVWAAMAVIMAATLVAIVAFAGDAEDPET